MTQLFEKKQQGRMRNNRVVIMLSDEELKMLNDKVKKTNKSRQEVLLKLIKNYVWRD